MKPEVRYARNGDVAIGFTIVGDGPNDLVYLPAVNHIDVAWENPQYARFLRSLSRFARLIVVDRRGNGISDRYSPADIPPLEDVVDDLFAVLDAAGSDRPVLFGFSDTGLLCAMFAATHPERVSGLVLHATAARGTQAPDYPWQWSETEWERHLERVKREWGTRAHAERTIGPYAPSLAGDERMLAWWERFLRASASPSGLYAQELLFREMDVRRLLPAIGVPTLISHRVDDEIEPVGAAHYLAAQISGAELLELPGADHPPWAGDQDPLIDAIEAFVGRVWQEEKETFDRVLATVLFTDIVDSTKQAAALGDARWREVSDRHDSVTRAQLARFRGREVRWTGDGFLAVFDGPARAVRCAEAICESMRRAGVDIRAGLHTGEIALEHDDISGMAVAIGARVAALAGRSEVLVSSTVKDLVVGSGLAFDDRGTHELKGVPDAWRLYALADGSSTGGA